MRCTVPVLVVVGTTVAEPHAIGTPTVQTVIPTAEAYVDAELCIVINYQRWRVRRKRN
jgi:hypothetical protein